VGHRNLDHGYFIVGINLNRLCLEIGGVFEVLEKVLE